MYEREREGTSLRMARQELEDLYLGVPDDSVDLTFRDLILPPPPSSPSLFTATSTSASANKQLAEEDDDDDDDDDENRNSNALLRSSTNIFAYKLAAGHLDNGGNRGLELSPSPPPPAPVAVRSNKTKAAPPVSRAGAAGANYKRRRPGIPHSNICALCTNYVYLFRHRCLVCGRVYCRRCVGAGMGDMTEGRKCIDCLGRRYSHRYIHRAGAGGCYCFWPNSVKAQELVWAEKGPAPRRRPSSSSSSSSISTSYSAAAAGGSASSMSMSMTMNNSSTNAPPAASSSSRPNPHAFPL